MRWNWRAAPALDVRIDWTQGAAAAGRAELAAAGLVTGASGRNWAGYGAAVELPAGFDPVAKALLTDPQTSGGLLVSCAPATADEVLAVFRRHGFDEAAVIGEIGPPAQGRGSSCAACHPGLTASARPVDARTVRGRLLESGMTSHWGTATSARTHCA